MLYGRSCAPPIKLTAVFLVLESEEEPGTAIKLAGACCVHLWAIQR